MLNSSEVPSPDVLLVKPRQACRLLGFGNTKLYELLAAGELQSFKDGKSRMITMESIRCYIARKIEEARQQ